MRQRIRSSMFVLTGVLVATGLSLASNPVSGQTARSAAAANGALPPIIDRELFFGDPEIAGAQISPDGQYIAFLKPFKGTRNIWVKRTGEAFDKATPITADAKRPISNYFWSVDSRFVLYAQDAAGDENFNVYAVKPSDPPPAGGDVPPARNITDAKAVQAQIYAVPKSDPDVIYVGVNDRDKAWHDLYKVKISTGERTLLRENTERITGWRFDRSDKLRLASRSAENGDTELLRVDDAGFTKIYSCSVFEECAAVRFHKDGQRAYLVTNKDVDLKRVTLLDVQTGKEDVVESDPEKRVDVATALFSDSTDELVATVYTDDKPRYVWKNKDFEADYRLLAQKLPGKDITFGSSTRDERLFIVSARADVDPGSVYLFDRQTKQLTPQYVLREKLPRSSLAPMTTVRYKSSDGLEIPAYLTLPKGAEAKQLPIIVLPHGGPWARDVWGYGGLVQFFANRGYAVLQPNFRGSVGYGKQFLDAGNRQWGDKMQDDITWGVKHLVDRGIADPKRVGILGGSYGGYATLAGVAFTPEVYAAAVSIVGPSNLITLMSSIPPYWEQARKQFVERMGDPSTPEGKAQLERQSPLNSAARIKTPLLVIQGANDPRVKKAESEQIVMALHGRGFPVEYILAPDEGHGFARPINNLAAFAAAEKFLAKHLKGRFQEYMGTEVSERLKTITVDPKTVTRTETITASGPVPKPASDFKVGVTNYQARLELGGQTMSMATSTAVQEEGDTWVVTDTAQTPMGEMIDRTTYAKGSLVVRKRSAGQGPMRVDYEVKDGKVIGEMKMNGQARPLSVDAGGDLFADGGGAAESIATLPIAEGYTTTFRNLDLQKQQIKAIQLKVVGSEQVTVPAGTFDAFKVELVSGDGGKTTMWIAKTPRRTVKSVTTLPAMNGATITSELQKN